MWEIAFWVACLALGIATHFLKKLVEARKVDKSLSARAYWLENPYATLLSIGGSLAAFGMLYEAGQLSAAMAFGAGYIGNSVADIAGSRAESAIKK